MRLDEWPAEMVAVALLATALGLVIWRWRRFRFRRASRFIALLLIQVLTIVAILVGVNISGKFYGSWRDVIGSTAGVTATTLTARPGSASTPAAENDWRPTAAERADDRRAAHASRILQIRLTGATTGYTEPATIYLPGSYTADLTRRYPVLQLQSGYPGTQQSWVKYLQLKQTLDGLIADGRMPAVIAAMVAQNPRPGYDSECVDADPSQMPGSLADTFLSHDVPAYLRNHYRVGDGRTNLVIGGYSTGGFCAANLALRHPQVYAGAIVLSGYFRPVVDRTTGPVYRTTAERTANTPLMTVRRDQMPIAFFLGAAADDAADMAALRSMQQLVPHRDPLQVTVTPTGAHSRTTWRVLSPTAFTWMASVLGR